jgi:hypothetical protein
MTGTETLFLSSGFVAVRRPSDNRVIMRRSPRERPNAQSRARVRGPSGA